MSALTTGVAALAPLTRAELTAGSKLLSAGAAGLESLSRTSGEGLRILLHERAVQRITVGAEYVRRLGAQPGGAPWGPLADKILEAAARTSPDAPQGRAITDAITAAFDGAGALMRRAVHTPL